MKNTTKLLFGSLILSGIGITAYLGNTNSDVSIEKYVPREGKFSKEMASKQSTEHFEKLRRNINTGKMENSDFSNAFQAFNAMAPSRSTLMTLKDEGPDNVGGRTRAILIDNSNINTIYAGSVSGGLFKSTNRGNTWARVTAFNTVLSVSCIAQTTNGTIYVGTGSTYERTVQNPQSSGGHKADGVYYSIDDGTTFTKLVPTTTPAWGNAAINAIVADPNYPDKVYIGGNFPVRLQEVTGANSFTRVSEISGSVTDLKISKDGNVIVAGLGINTFIKEGTGVFTNVSGSGPGQIKTAVASGGGSLQRVVYAISHEKNTNGKYSVYASMVYAGGRLAGVSASHDNGANWVEVIPATPNTAIPASVLTTDPFANGLGFQGVYDNTITVVPGNTKRFFIGGINMHQWNESSTSAPYGQMAQLSSWSANPSSSIYVHADNHTQVWDNTNRLYIGNDGGVGVSTNATSSSPTFYPANRGYNVTQFYAMGYSKYGDVIGGAQDNGTQYKDLNNPGTSTLEFKETGGGDGFDCDISNLNENVQFSTVYYGATYRSSNKGSSRSAFTSTEINALTEGVKPFHNNVRLYENANDLSSTDSVDYYATKNQSIGETIMVQSKNLGVTFEHVLTTPITVVFDDTLYIAKAGGGFDTSYTYLSRDTIKLQDKVQTLFAQGLRSSGGVWVTRGALRFGTTPVWWKVLNSVSGDVTEMEFSKDGDILYVGTSGGKVYRVKGFNGVYYDNTKHDTINGINDHDKAAYDYADIRSGVSQLQIQTIYSGTYVTGMDVDPNNSEHVVITLAGYGASTNILRSTTAASTTGTSSFTSIKGNMPTMPVYDAVIDMSDPTRMYAGTEFGLMITLNSGASWAAQNDEMGVVPVYEVKQQYRDWSECLNSGTLYLGTFGRGIWSSSDFSGINEIKKSEEIAVTAINLFPNPVVNQTNITFNLAKASDVTVTVYSISGQLISNKVLSNRQPGELKHVINASDLPKGVYFVNIQAEGMKFKAAKFIKQ